MLFKKMSILARVNKCIVSFVVLSLIPFQFSAAQTEDDIAPDRDAKSQYEYHRTKGREADKNGLFKIAELHLLKAEKIVEEMDEDDRDKYRQEIYCNLRDMYLGNEMYDSAFRYNRLDHEVVRRLYTPNDEEYYLPYSFDAQVYHRLNDKEKCYACLDSMLVNENAVSLETLSLLYLSRISVFMELGEMEKTNEDVVKIVGKISGRSDEVDEDTYSYFLQIMGLFERQRKQFDDMELHTRQSAELMKRKYGPQSFEYAKALTYLATSMGFAGHGKEGIKVYLEAVEIYKNFARERMPYLTSVERTALWREPSVRLHDLTSYVTAVGYTDNEYVKASYDALLLNKAFLLETERSIYDILKQSGDEETLRNYALLENKRTIQSELEKNYKENGDSIMTIAAEIEELDKQLTRKSSEYGDFTSFFKLSYKDVKQALKENEVLIDFTDFQSETYGGECYGAYIINNSQENPTLKFFFNTAQMDSIGIMRPDMYYDPDFAPEVIKLLWNPIKEYAVEGDTIYYVPSQLLFQVSLESLPLEDGTLLGDHYNFVRLSSARELIKRNSPRLELAANQTATLYGGLQYDVEPMQMANEAKQYDLSSLFVMRGESVRGDSIFHELPGSKREIEQIEKILHNSKYNVTSYTGMNGTEESFLNMHKKSPRILHLATHGFYYTPSKAESIDFLKGYTDAMLLSGLVLSGGNAAWRGEELPEGVLGGILTSSNIARLDLSGTDMVVLSACQSGQGNATPEGLFGLQRAFKKAGVGTIVMALWNVSDRVATDFMVRFYECLADKGNDWNKRKAFDEAKSYIRSQYKDPFYWAAFVMLD